MHKTSRCSIVRYGIGSRTVPTIRSSSFHDTEKYLLSVCRSLSLIFFPRLTETRNIVPVDRVYVIVVVQGVSYFTIRYKEEILSNDIYEAYYKKLKTRFIWKVTTFNIVPNDDTTCFLYFCNTFVNVSPSKIRLLV